MQGVPSTTNDTYQCGACNQEMHGYTWSELSKDDGWCSHMQNGVTFILCGECERKFAARRAARKAVEQAVAH